VNRRAILSYWQASHGALDEDVQARFLARPEVDDLLDMADETARMAVRAHQRLADELRHARWLSARRLGESGCGCVSEDADDLQSDDHRLSIIAGPDTRVGGPGGPRSSTSVGTCSCGWERRGADPAFLRVLWKDHVSGDEEEPVLDW
jgi:hypothetical protein